MERGGNATYTLYPVHLSGGVYIRYLLIMEGAVGEGCTLHRNLSVFIDPLRSRLSEYGLWKGIARSNGISAL